MGIEQFEEWLGALEIMLLDLLAPITAQDQHEIQSILDLAERSMDDIERLFTLIERRGANYAFFFAHATDASWIPILKERGCFSQPPNMETMDDGQVNAPTWWPIHYLSKVAGNVPDEVSEVVLQLPKVDNPGVNGPIIDIALKLQGSQSVKLKNKVLDYAKTEPRLLAYKYSDLLAHWVAEDENTAAVDLAEVLVKFVPDPESEDKQERRRENPQEWMTLLQPSPGIDNWEYQEILGKGVRPIAEKDPYRVARMLIDATAGMIHLGTHQDAIDSGMDEDQSELWCPDLIGQHSERAYEESREPLVHTLTFACEKVFEITPNLIPALDEYLRQKRWKLFRRLRQHLYALHPTEETKPWIRELILEQEDYDRWPHHCEFQQMARSACERFGAELLTQEELGEIFEAFLSGPPEEVVPGHQRKFHQLQFKPFVSVLFGKYSAYFQELEDGADQQIADEDYLQIRLGKGGAVRRRSPRSPRDLADLTDEDLLTFINEWDVEHRYESDGDGDEWMVAVNIEALAEAFQSVFKESVIPDDSRFRFWIEHREKVERPIYVKAMISGMEDHVKEKSFTRLGQSLDFCEWVLSHPDQEIEAGYWSGDQSRENPHWDSSRRAVGDLVGSCLEENVDVPVAAHQQLAKLLDMLCTQFDRRLDGNEPVFLGRNDQRDEAINNTRSRALESLVKFGLWLERNDRESDIPLVMKILEKRFAPDTEFPLTLPEYATLGVNYGLVLGLDEAWATGHRSDFFPQDTLLGWRAAFGTLLRFTHPHSLMFNVLREDFVFALQNMADLKQQDSSREAFTDILGSRLFTYYLWGMHPLKGEGSLIEQFYQSTDGEPEHWGHLFDHIGVTLRNTSKGLDDALRDRLVAFFEWRLEVREAKELGKFSLWLEAECLEEEWRLNAFSRILDICQPEGRRIYGLVKTLTELLPDHAAKVVECFAKLTDKLENDTFHIRTEPAKRILKTGLGSDDERVCSDAERALDNLLKRGRSDLLDTDD